MSSHEDLSERESKKPDDRKDEDNTDKSKFVGLPKLQMSVYGISPDQPKTFKNCKILENPARATSKSSKSSNSPDQNTTSKSSLASKKHNSPRPQSSQVRFTDLHSGGVRSLNSTLPMINSNLARKNLTTQPGDPIILNTKKFSDNNAKNSLESSFSRFGLDPSTGSTSTGHNFSTVSSELTSPPKLSTTVSTTSSFTRILARIRTEPNFPTNFENEPNTGDVTDSENGVNIPPLRQNRSLNHSESSQSFKSKLSEDDEQIINMTREAKENLLREFDLKTTVGTGTFGRVLMVRSASMNRVFALKMMSIVDIVKRKQIQHVKNERTILENIRSHPFIVKLFWVHHDKKHLYFLFEYVPGGELFTRLRQKGRFETRTAVFYSCEIVCALEFLHSRSIVYRDLKPENILIDKDGHIKLTDMGFAKKCHDKTYTLCGTPEYLAPEVLNNRGHNFTCDWWSLGIIRFEFLSGSPPFYDENREKIYRKILEGKINWPVHIDSVARDLIKKLLTVDPTKRLGSGNCGIIPPTISQQSPTWSSNRPSLPFINNNNTNQHMSRQSSSSQEIDSATSTSNGFFVTEIELVPLSEVGSGTPSAESTISSRYGSSTSLYNTSLDHASLKRQKINMGSEEVKRHNWFIGTNWNDVYFKRLIPPYVPDVAHEADTQNFEKYDPVDFSKVSCAPDNQIDHFKDF